MVECRKDHSKVGLIYLCTFILLKLSGERNFGVSLNKPHRLVYLVCLFIYSSLNNLTF
jgi:hypothetical protein